MRSISDSDPSARTPLHALGPDAARGAHLGDLEIEVHADAPEEGEPTGELVDVHALRERGAHVVEPVRDREGQLLDRRRPGFLHVVAGDRDRVELRHLLRRVLDDVGHDPHARLGRIDVGVADHELLEDVVLDRAGELLAVDALLLTRHDEARQHGHDRAVHRHRDRHLIERDLVEEDLHVLDGVDRDAGLADVARHARMVRVVAAMGREIEGHREALLARGEVRPVEGVRLFGGREARVLAQRPGPVRVHRRARAAQEGEDARQRVRVLEALEIGRRVERLDRRPSGLVQTSSSGPCRAAPSSRARASRRAAPSSSCLLLLLR